MLQMILRGANDVLAAMTHGPGENVVVHCSDGWDRTSQITSLVQLMLDPFFRTIDGFKILIEKDWLSFGHMFGRRFGHFSAQDTGNRSPVFVQFLDCVHQLWHQMPQLFEFNTDLLLYLAEHVYSCKYGTFLMNHPKERQLNDLSQKTISIWVEVKLRKAMFKNPYYDLLLSKERVTVIPVTDYMRLRVWREHYFKYSEDWQRTVKQSPDYQLDTRAAEVAALIERIE